LAVIALAGVFWAVVVFVSSAGAAAQSDPGKSGAGGRIVIEQVAPVYPEIAKRNRIAGAVKLEVVVRPDGSVKSAKALGGSPALIESASGAVRKWKFEVKPQETTEVVQVTFRQ
jgi:protein TonB